jgi:hypothetical protein
MTEGILFYFAVVEWALPWSLPALTRNQVGAGVKAG